MTPRFVLLVFSIAFVLATTFAVMTTVKQIHNQQATIAGRAI